ncbi:MAG TPA: AMP-binding protein [Pseudonocardiaceae bacterium]|jgi:amino acid adenylation domain-containing protein|nr:AMP-binding protein [Pseudonocardiaceae bacterium]
MAIDFAGALWTADIEPPCLIRTIIAGAGEYPDRIAVIDGDLELRYDELLDWSAEVARLLLGNGVRRGDRVAVACPRGAPAVAALLATALAGFTYVPLDPEYPRARLDHMLRDSGARVVLYNGELWDLPETTTPLRIPEWTGGQSRRPGRWPGQTWVAEHDAELAVYIIYTSGSTGWPKGVALPHSCLDNVAEWQARVSPVPDLRTAQFAPLNFDVSFQEIFGTLCGGGTLVIMPERLRREPVDLLDWLVEHRVRRLFLPYVALQMLAVAIGFGAPVDRLELTEINVAGEQLVITDDIRQLFDRLPGCRLMNHYGQSESAMVSAHLLTGPPAQWPTIAPIGLPLPGCELLLDPVDDAGDGVGELLVGGSPVALGYVDRPELNARRYVAVPTTAHGSTRLFRTGDLVRFVDGAVHFVTRLDDDVKLRGIRVNLVELDAQLMAQPEIAAAVSVVRQQGQTRSLRAGVVLKQPGTAFDEQDVLRRLRLVLPEAFVPASVSVIDALPRTPSGKLDRDAVAVLVEQAVG